MRKYIQHLQDTKTPHERRQFAMQVAVVATGLLFVGWLATLSVRVGSQVPTVVQQGAQNSAAALEAVQDSSQTRNSQ